MTPESFSTMTTLAGESTTESRFSRPPQQDCRLPPMETTLSDTMVMITRPSYENTSTRSEDQVNAGSSQASVDLGNHEERFWVRASSPIVRRHAKSSGELIRPVRE